MYYIQSSQGDGTSPSPFPDFTFRFYILQGYGGCKIYCKITGRWPPFSICCSSGVVPPPRSAPFLRDTPCHS